MTNSRAINGGLVVPYTPGMVSGQRGNKPTKSQARPPRPPRQRGQPRRSRPRRANRRTGSNFASGSSAVSALRDAEDQLCSLLNPFCPAAKGRKYPDGLNAASLTYQFRGHLPNPTFVSTNSHTGWKVKFAPFLPYGYLQATDSAGSWAIPGGSTTLPGTHTLFVNNANAFRVVSAGLIVRCVCNTSNAQGYLIIGKSNGLNLSGTETTADDAYMETQTVPVYAGLECAVINRPVGATAYEFNGQGVNTANYDASFWDTISVELVGGTSNTTIDIQFVVNCEFTCVADNDITQLAPPDPPKRLALTEAANYVRLKLSSVFEKGDMVLDAAIRTVAQSAGNAVIRRITTTAPLLLGA